MLYYERIRALREEHHLTQIEVAALLHVTQKTYSDYELGRSRISVDKIHFLARYYDCSVDYITGASNIRSSYPIA